MLRTSPEAAMWELLCDDGEDIGGLVDYQDQIKKLFWTTFIISFYLFWINIHIVSKCILFTQQNITT